MGRYRVNVECSQKLPQTTVAVDDPETLEKVLKLLEMLDDNDDVQNVYANVDFPEDMPED